MWLIDKLHQWHIYNKIVELIYLQQIYGLNWLLEKYLNVFLNQCSFFSLFSHNTKVIWANFMKLI